MSQPTAAERKRVLRRDDYACLRCAAPVAEDAHVHHRRLRSQMGDNGAANLVTLCPLCHHWVHHHVAVATALGWIVPSWDQPEGVRMLTWRGWITVQDDGTWSPDTPPEANPVGVIELK